MRREKASMTNATFTQRDHVDTYVMSGTHNLSGTGGALDLAPDSARQAVVAHQPLDGAPSSA